MNDYSPKDHSTDALAVVQETTPMRVSNVPSTELIVRDGQVLLPETRCVAPADKEFEEHVLAKAIPHDELPELLEALHGRHPAYTPAMKLLFLVGFVAIGLLVYFFRPRFPQLVDSSDVLVIDTQTSSKVSSKYSALLKQATAAYDTGRFAEVKEMLAPKMDAILMDKESFRENARLASLFFSAHQKSGFPKDVPELGKWLGMAGKYDPDNLEWSIYRICLDWQPFQKIHKAEYRVEAVLNNEMRSCLVRIACLKNKTKIEKIRNLNANKPPENRLTDTTLTTLDLIECQVLITRWRMEGGKTLPDDVGEPGVESREQAYSLAAKHENDIAFLDLQLLIAQRVLDGLVPIPFFPEKYYFNGENHWESKDLQEIIADIKLKKQKLSPTRKHQ